VDQVWDVGGQDKIRKLWRHYYAGTHGVIFVVDAADKHRVATAREELDAILDADEVRTSPGLPRATPTHTHILQAPLAPPLAPPPPPHTHVHTLWKDAPPP
jgi:hypothetical protein